MIDSCLTTVTMVKHLMDEEGNILSFADFQERFPNVGLDFLTYHGLVSPVMTCQKKRRRRKKEELSLTGTADGLGCVCRQKA